LDSHESFQHTWDEYKHGFGDLFGSFYLGNDHIHAMTSQGSYELMVEVTDWTDKAAHAHYMMFHADSEEHGYKLKYANYNLEMLVTRKGNTTTEPNSQRTITTGQR
jgi:hypothetical protein